MTVTNPSASPCFLLRGECLGCVEPVESCRVIEVPDDTPDLRINALNPSAMTPSPLGAFHASIDDALDPAQKVKLLGLLHGFRYSLDCAPHSLGRTSTVTHFIDTGLHAPLRQRPYRVSPSERRTIDEQLNDMLQRGIIRPSNSPWASAVVIVTKKDDSIIFCGDYRRLNHITRKDVYPLPRIDDAIDCLYGAQFVSSLHLRSGYWQVPVTEADRSKTAFITPDGLIEFNIMPFGFRNAPATFERIMDNILPGLKWKTCLCYLDDIVIL